MKVILKLATLACFFLICGSTAAAGQCDNIRGKNPVILTIIFQFDDSSYRQRWIYDSLYPYLTFRDVTEFVLADNTVIDGEGSWAMEFCVDGETVPPLNSDIFFHFGPNTAKIKSRPISWTELSGGYRGWQKLGKMSQIYFLAQPSPNWAILKSASILPTTNRNIEMLEAIVENFSDRTVELKFLTVESWNQANDPNCTGGIQAPPVHTQNVFLSWERIISGLDGAAWTQLNNNQMTVIVEYKDRGCDGLEFNGTIPIDTTIDAHKTSRIRVLVTENPTRSFKKPSRGIPPPSSIFRWTRSAISLGEDIYPFRLVLPKP